ncbi:tape measure protein [Ornithobacterium rhinotracheale]|uniref:tape measure protein n=1 Tax=Ornithobacterium rhinotracheale TaxID=28251 RepID=UPI001FF59A33|nr:tape measure protein [Ornithobacterium rhinotracheale]MCK0201372.1 tape measure protein [Ornithobacterium rhinotracheale]
MNSINGNLSFEALLSTEEFDRRIKALEAQIQGVSNTAVRETQRMDSGFKNLALSIGAYFSGRMLLGLTQEVINVRGEFQKTEIALETMLGSSEKAKSLLKDMVDLAAKTPFSLQDITEGTKQLLAFKVPAEEVVDTLTRLGNIAAGLSIPLGRIQLVFGQVRAKGKLMGDDLRQFTEAGIPMVAELAKKFGVAEKAIYEMVSAGKVGFNDVKDVLFAMTNEGGMFFNLMEKQSQSLSGKISNLQDSITQMFNEIGESNEGLLNTGIDGISYIVEHYQALIDILEGLVITYGVSKSALILYNVVQKENIVLTRLQAISNINLNSVQKLGVIATMRLRQAQQALNATMLANPYVLTAALLTSLIYVMIKYANTTSIAEKAQSKLKEQEKARADALEELKSKTQALISVINDQNATEYQQIKAYNELITLYPELGKQMDFYAFKAMSAEERTKLLSEAQDDFSLDKLKSDVDLGVAKVAQLEKQLKELYEVLTSANPNSANAIQQQIDRTQSAIEQTKIEIEANKKKLKAEEDALKYSRLSTEEKIKYQEELKENAKKNLEEASRKAQELEEQGNWVAAVFERINIRNFLNQLNEAQNKLDGLKESQQAVSGTKQSYLNKKKGLEDDLSKVEEGDTAERDRIRNEIKKVNKSLEFWDTTEKSVSKVRATPKKIAEKILPKGSLAEIEKRISKINEKLNEAVKPTDKEKYKSELVKAQAEAEKARKSIAIQSEDEIIDAKIKKWQLYYKAIDQYGKDSDYVKSDFFKDLKTDEISSLADFLQSELSKIDLSEGSSERFEKLSDLLAEISGESTTALDSFNQSLDELKLKSKNAYEYLEKLHQEQEKLKGKEKTPNNVAKNKAIDDRIKQEENTIREGYEKFKEMHRTFEEQKAEITEKYARLRQEIENDKSLSEDQKAQYKAESVKAEAKELSKVIMKSLTNKEDWQEAFGEIEKFSLMKLHHLKQVLQNYLDQLKKEGGATPEAVKVLTDQMKKIDEAVAHKSPLDDLFKKFKDIGKAGAQAGSGIEKFGSKAAAASVFVDALGAQIGQTINDLEDLGLNVSDDFKQTVQEVTQGIGETLKGVGNLAEGIASKNPIQVVQGVFQVVKGMAKIFNGDRKREREVKRHEQAVKRLKSAYEDLARSMQKAIGTDYFKQGEKSIENLKRQVEELQQAQRAERSKKKRDQGKIDGYDDEIRRAKQQQEDIIESMQKELLKTDFKSFADKLNDAFVNAFDGGQNAVKALGNSIDEMIKGAVTNALKLQFLEAPIKRNLDKLAKKMEGGRIPQAEELQAFARDMNEELTYQMEAYKKMYEGLGLGKLGAGGTELKNAIQGMSEETAGILEGQFNAVRVNTASILAMNQEANNIIADQLRMLQGIRENTEPIKRLSDDVYEILKIVKSSNGKKI